MTQALFDRITLHKVIEFFITGGTKVCGKVVSKDESWIAVRDSESEEPIYLNTRHVYAFRVHRH